MTEPAGRPVALWLHLGDGGPETGAVRSLLSRLAQDGDDPSTLVTVAKGDAAPDLSDLPLDIVHAELPADHGNRARAFIDTWSPELLVWLGGNLRPVLLDQVRQAGIPALWVNARDPAPVGRRGGLLKWRPRVPPEAFRRILACDGASAARLRRTGVPPERIDITGPLEEEVEPIPYDPNELTVMAEAVNTRPVWHAAGVMPGEVAPMAEAHKAASRRGHRLLLLVTPRDLDDGSKVGATLRAAGLRTGIRSEGHDPEEELQAYVTDLPDELGLWYRLAPLSFMGGSFDGPAAMPPLQAAVLGSVVLNGPQTDPFAADFARLETHGASRTVRSSQELGLSVGALIAPDRVAAMAMNGWEVLTGGAEVMNRVLDLIRATLDGERAA